MWHEKMPHNENHLENGIKDAMTKVRTKNLTSISIQLFFDYGIIPTLSFDPCPLDSKHLVQHDSWNSLHPGGDR